MRVKMPRKVKVGGMVYDVVFPYVFSEDIKIAALHESRQNTIKVSKLWMGKQRAVSKIHESFLHEIFHAVDVVYCGDVLDHDCIYLLASGLYQVLVDNKLNLGVERRMPKKVKIGGFYYNIDFPFCSQDMEGVNHISQHEWLEVKLSGYNLDYDFDWRFTKQGLLQAVMNCLCVCHHMNPEEIGEEDSNGSIKNVTCLSNGLYQVIVDNKIEELFRNGR